MIPTLRPKEASAAGYKPITDSVVVDGDIYKSMADGMAGVDAVWISEGPYRAKLARKKNEVVLVSKDARRNLEKP